MLSKKSSDPGRNKLVIFFLKLSVSACALYLVFSKTDIGHTFEIIRNINPAYFVTAAGLYIAAQLLSTIRWKLLLPEMFSVKRLFSLYMIGAFFSSFLPGVIGGDMVKAYYLNKDTKKMGMTLASIFMDRYMGYVSLMIVGITAFPFAQKYFGNSPYKWSLPLIFAAFVVGSLMFFGLRFGRRFKILSDLYEYLGTIRSQKKIIAKTLLLSIFIQFVNFFMVVILAVAMGENIPLLVLFVFLPIVVTLTTLPISISGLGVREGAFVVLLGLIGVRPEVSASLSLSWFFSVFIGSLPGLVAYIRHTR